jgi:hypothetical protein
VVGHADRPALEAALDGRVVEDVVQRRVGVAAEGKLVVEAVEVHARRGEHDAVDDEQRGADHPHAPQLRALLEHRPARERHRRRRS